MNGTISHTPGGLTKKDIKTVITNGNKRYLYKSRVRNGKYIYKEYLKYNDAWQHNIDVVATGSGNFAKGKNGNRKGKRNPIKSGGRKKKRYSDNNFKDFY